MKTFVTKPAEVERKWYVVDAEGQTLGRLATKLAATLRGKHKTNFTPHADCGDNVIVINAEKVALSGNKRDSKEYIHHTGYPGGQRFRSVDQVLAKDPTGLVTKAVKGMLPKNRLGRAIFKNMHAYAGGEHPHEAQKPRTITLN